MPEYTLWTRIEIFSTKMHKNKNENCEKQRFEPPKKRVVVILTLAHFLYFTTFVSGGGGDWCDPPGIWKLSVVELSRKNSGLLSTSTRDW